MKFPFYIFGRRSTPQAGANAIARLAYFAPAQSPIGMGVATRSQLAIFQPPQIVWPWQKLSGGMVAPALQMTRGLGGITGGQVNISPPFDPNAVPSVNTYDNLGPQQANG